VSLNYGPMTAAKDRVMRLILLLAKPDNNVDCYELDAAVTTLNKEWDLLLTTVWKQREERDQLISRLLDELAEAKK
jgi:hypothetical protein